VLFEMTGGLVKAHKTLDEPIYGYKLESSIGPARPAQKTKFEDVQWGAASNGVKDYDYRAVSPTRVSVWRH
jgi:hypothetical protein